MEFDERRMCYDILSDANWKITEIPYVIKANARYRQFSKNFNTKDMFLKAFCYAGKCDYINMIMRRIIKNNENGDKLAAKAFHVAFPEFRDLSDLYDYCYELSNDSQNIKRNAALAGINAPIITYYASESQKSKKEQMLKIKEQQKELREKYPVYCKTIDFLLRTKDEEKIIEYFDGVTEKLVYKKLYDIACILYNTLDYSALNLTLKRRFAIYQSHVTKRSVRERALNTTKKFVDSDEHIKTFCEKEGFSLDAFRDMVKLVKSIDPELYKKFKAKNAYFQDDHDLLLEIVQYINYGIDNRPFTIIDFFTLTKRCVRGFYLSVKPFLTEKTSKKVRIFCNRYGNMVELTVSEILSENIEFNCKLDDKNMPIPNTGHIITDEEKMIIINQINDDGLPLYQPVYKYYLDKYFNKEDENVLKKTL